MVAPLTDGVSLWLPRRPAPRPPLPGDRDADVAVVGAGFTGLWTALHLLRADPALRVVVLEQEYAGFGASGRNGGWCSALFPLSFSRLAARTSVPAASAMRTALRETVDRVGADAAAEGVDCDFAKGGTIVLARSPAQRRRLEAEVDASHATGDTPDDLRWLDEGEARSRLGATDVVGGTFTPHCAALSPGRLVRGLADAVERRGGTVAEQTRVLDISPGTVRTERGTVRADVVVRATEGFTARLPGHARALAPVYSLMVATEPLPEEVWRQLGLRDRETFTDGRHLLVYGQRTGDGRLAFGGRGAPYHLGSQVQPRFDREPRVFAALHRTLVGMFPQLAGVALPFAWGGPLGIARDWMPSVGLDPATGLGWAGGYVGDGVAASHLAGRTLADLVLGRDTDETRLPWVGHRSRPWEPEPLRYLGVNAALRLTAAADVEESRTRRPGVLGRLVERLTSG